MKKNAYAITILIVIVACLCLSSLFLYTRTHDEFNAENGYINLSNEDLTNKLIALDGTWEFYKNTYCSDFSEQPSYISSPSAWNSSENKNLDMPKFGKATYRLKITLPKAGYYMFHIPFIHSSYELYANGTCIAKAGTIANDGRKEIDAWKPQNAVYYADTKELELVMYISNYQCHTGGMVYSIVLGSYDAVFVSTILQIGRSALFMGIFIGFGLYLILLYQKGTNIICLHLGIFCICCMMLESSIGSHIASFLIRNSTYSTLQRLEYVPSFIAMLMIISVYRERFPKQQYKWFLIPLFTIDIIVTVLSACPIHNILNLLTYIGYPILAYNMLYCSVVLINAVRNREKYANLSTLSFFTMVIGIVVDALGLINIIYAFSKCGLYVIGIIIFIIAQMYILSRETLDIYEQSCKAKDMEIAYLQAQIAPHFFFNTLNNVYTMMVTDLEGAQHLLSDFCSFLRVKYKFDYRKNVNCHLEQEIDFISTYISIENSRFNNMISFETNIDKKYLSIAIPQLLLQPLVENSVKHGFDNKPLTICISTERVDNMLKLIVHDNGRGMGRGYAKTVLTSKSESKGIGLQNVAYRLQKCYHTTMEVQSRVGFGTDIILYIPLEENKAVYINDK